MDYPAAHSMDTTWFAVDGEGHVAVLDSYEAGAVPEDWGHSQDDLGLIDYLRQSGIPIDPADLSAVPPEDSITIDSERARQAADDASAYDVLLLVTDPRARDRIPSARWLPTTSGHLLWAPGPVPMRTLRDLLRRGLIRRGWLHGSPHSSWYGLYTYAHDFRYENSRSGPYARSAVPRAPLRLEDLPAPLQSSAVRLPGVSFARDVAVQPFEHLPCRSWQSVWVDTAGEEHPIRDDD